jgi:ElaA protein
MDTNSMIEWTFKHFDALSVHDLYEILVLRSRVFVVEQNCIFLDMDGFDKHAHHLSGYAEGKLVAYTRILPKGIAYPEYPSIGRVVTAPEARGKKYGFSLMQESIKRLYNLYSVVPIKIGAQLYLKKFYESLGFVQAGEVYLEDGIEHIPMINHPMVS